MLAEERRLKLAAERKANWLRWGPYLAERQWGTVREDYSEHGQGWSYFPHDHARSRAYRWGEDGLLGITDRECRVCFATALWNGRDPILKERFFGLTGPEGNHGEDVKECYYYLDSSPSHSYMKALYKYPQSEFPYGKLVEENRRRGKEQTEYELADTGVFDEGMYFDVLFEYAKQSPNDILIRITAANRGPQAAALHLLPTVWARNTWRWGCEHEGCWIRPRFHRVDEAEVRIDHVSLGKFLFAVDPGSGGTPKFLFTENETNSERIFGAPNPAPYAKDGFHEYLINGRQDAVNLRGQGTKVAAHWKMDLAAGEERVFKMRIFGEDERPESNFGVEFDRMFEERIAETDDFYAHRIPNGLGKEERRVYRQACAGLLWSKQFYHYSVQDWLKGDPEMPPPPEARKFGRNSDWTHVFNRDVISMPDKWEYPWYAAWDLAFHMIPFVRLDPYFTKQQLILLLREWYMHPNGQIPAYEYSFSDVNPPVHAWACWRVYKMSAPRGKRDRVFLARAFQKLLLNFTWWVNRKDPDGRHVFSGGFLGLDNIGVFDRSKPLPTGGRLNQADGTAWMAFYCVTMLEIALELASEDPAYEDVASKFFEHFIAITDAMNSLGGTGLWDDEDGFYYDQLMHDHATVRIKTRSLVGLIPLTAVVALREDFIARLPGFRKRMEWFLTHRRDLADCVTYMEQESAEGKTETHRLLAIPTRDRLARVLRYMFDENEFLSPFGIRSMSRAHAERPFVLHLNAQEYRTDYQPGESNSYLFGGNSNWRGPVWFPINFLLIEALERYHYFFGDSFLVEFPTGSGRMVNLKEAAREIGARLVRLFLPDSTGNRPLHGGEDRYALDPNWKDLVLFYEYFHGETGRGLGASHQTGWTALIAKLLENQVR
jgi:hypothetical protein